MTKTTVHSSDIRDGTITDADIATANKDGASGTASLRTLGTGAAQAAAGNDARLAEAATHVADTSAAHAASSVAFTPNGSIAATDVQAAIQEVRDEAGAGGGAPSTADYLVGTADAGLSNEIPVGTTPGGELGGTWASPTVDATHSGSAHHTESHASRHAAAGADAVKLDDLAAPDDNTDLDATTGQHGLLKKLGGGSTNFLRADGTWAAPSGSGAPASVDYLVGTADGGLSSEIVVGTTPGGELGGTWASPTVDATHSGSAHHSHGAGAVLQVVTAVSTSDNSTTAVTYQASSLSATITPQLGTSKLLVTVHGECEAYRSAGTILERFGWVAIQNTTNAVQVCEQPRGRNLIGTNAALATVLMPIALQGIYTVNSTAARTFQLQYKSGLVTNVAFDIKGTRAGGVIMTIMEIAV